MKQSEALYFIKQWTEVNWICLFKGQMNIKLTISSNDKSSCKNAILPNWCQPTKEEKKIKQ